jgi:hypothetical protein
MVVRCVPLLVAYYAYDVMLHEELTNLSVLPPVYLCKLVKPD